MAGIRRAPTELSLAERAGQAPGEWRIIARVGEGASATVFRAEDAKGRPVALKVEREGGAGRTWIEREATLLAQVCRRWGPELLDAGQVPDGGGGGFPAFLGGRAYLATSWTEGSPLDVAAASTGDREQLLLRVAHGVGRALDELHSMGIRHGDVKPANVLVDAQADGGAERAETRSVTLIDLGLATPVDAEVLGGTGFYLAPELLSGAPPSPAADLYALGLVLAAILEPSRLSDEAVSVPDLASWGEVGHWVTALLAREAGARPSARWLADRAAARLGLVADDAEILAARRARVRRAYLAVREPDLRPGTAVSSSAEGPTADWVRASISVAERFSPDAAQPVTTSTISPLDSFAISRWLVSLVGPAAASWSLPALDEEALAPRLLALCEVAPPEAWTRDDIVRGPSSVAQRKAWSPGDSGLATPGDDTNASEPPWIAWTRLLVGARPDEAALLRMEGAANLPDAPATFAVDLATALLRRGEIGRAFTVLSSVKVPTEEGQVLLAELARRRGDADGSNQRATLAAASSDAGVRDRARAISARLAWDRGDVASAERLIGDARGAFAAEVRALIAYARGEFERGLRVVAEASADAYSAIDAARLEATRGMLEHARGHAAASMAAHAWAADVAAREGAVVEEATYLTGLAAAAVDAGAVTRALSASTRASLLWERLGQPGRAARALLSRAAAFALVGAMHESERMASLAGDRARASGDRRAAIFAQWAWADTRPADDAKARRQILEADSEVQRLAEGVYSEDRVRSSSRVLLWADVDRADVEVIDRSVITCSPTARWEWWGARAASWLRVVGSAPSPSLDPGVRDEGASIVSSLVALLSSPAPVGVRGPALHAGMRVASELGDGNVARRFEVARRTLLDEFQAHVPVEHRASLASVEWTHLDSGVLASAAMAFDAGQVEQLGSIVRALSSRDRLKPLLEQVLDTMILWAGVERGLLLLRAPEGHLVPRAARNLRRQDLVGEQRTLSMGIAKRAMEQGKPVIATDAFAQLGDLHASVHALRLRSVLAVPLIARGEALGVVYLDDRARRGAFGPKELAWVELVATQAALAVADARDQVQLRRAVRRAERASARLEATLAERESELASVRTELAQATDTRFSYDEIVGRSEPLRTMLKLVDRVTASDVPVLLIGESGTGKEVVARAIHRNGARSSRPFVSENCGAVPEALLESALFGHVRGAFTGASQARAGLFEIADGGTLFLDEIGEMPLPMQTKLLRVLQTGELRPVGSERTRRVDVRIVAATHRDLAAMVAQRTFREDLFYRINVVSLRVPPLRERASDISLLTAHFLEKHAPDRSIKVTRAAMDRLSAFPWPGNVRQLENELRRALVLAEDRIDLSELSDEVARGDGAASRDAGIGLKARVDALERQLLQDALERTKGNQTRAAEALGLSRYGLQKMMQRLGLRAE